jgi:hypothetical protein
MQPRLQLPPISEFLHSLPTAHIALPPPAPPPPPPVRASIPAGLVDLSGQSVPYTPQEDLTILKFVGVYFGLNFRGPLPWSFWPTFRQSIGSVRSISSLYHHWTGSMTKKYGSYLTTGKLADCIRWLENSVPEAEFFAPPLLNPQAGYRLVHVASEPPGAIGGHFEASRTLVRTPSFAPCGTIPCPHPGVAQD